MPRSCRRLVLPHRNAGFGQPVGPDQAVALLSQMRYQDSIGSLPNIKRCLRLARDLTSSEWGWRFVVAIGHYLATGETYPLVEAAQDAADAASCCAATAAAAAAMLEAGRADEA